LGEEKWEGLTQVAEFKENSSRRAVVLLYAHLFRLSVEHPALRKEQTDLLLQSPNVMNSLLNISLARNWLAPSLAAMRLNAYLAQAVPLPPRVMRESDLEYLKFAQLPGIELKEVPSLKNLSGFDALINSFEASKDARVPEIKKAVQRWGKLEVVETSFKVIGEKIVTPLAIIFLVVKLRIPTNTSNIKAPTPQEAEARENEFLLSKKEAEDPTTDGTGKTWAHAPHWPSVCPRPSHLAIC
jgi:translocation protein SEC63